jgi:hypothetical protein
LINVGCGFILDYKVSSNISSPMIMWLYERIDNVTMTMNLGVGLEIEIMPEVVRSVFKFPYGPHTPPLPLNEGKTSSQKWLKE